MIKKHTVSIIIPSYNSARTVEHTIQNVLKQTNADQIANVIIVDSSDDRFTKEILVTQVDKKVRIITSGVHVMPAIQRNIGAKEAKGDILCFIDSDAFPASNWIEKILEAYSKGWKVGGGSYLIPDFQIKNKLAYAQYYLQFNEYIDTGKPRIKKMVPTCNLFCDKKLFNELGGFPEIRASEDTLFGLKVNKIEKMMFIPEVKVYHIFREDVEDYLENQKMLGLYAYICRKHYYNPIYLDDMYMPLLYPVFIIVKYVRICVRILMPPPCIGNISYYQPRFF